MAKLQPCSVGIRLNTESDCHKLTYNRSCKLNTLGQYSVQQISLIHCRTELNLTNVDTKCLHHEKLFLFKYEELQRSCRDPYCASKGQSGSLPFIHQPWQELL